jgi:hypothetical protein
MQKSELKELLQEYEDANSSARLIDFLKDQLIQSLEDFPAEKDNQKHRLNMIVREIEQELDWIENEKLAEFDPER